MASRKAPLSGASLKFLQNGRHKSGRSVFILASQPNMAYGYPGNEQHRRALHPPLFLLLLLLLHLVSPSFSQGLPGSSALAQSTAGHDLATGFVLPQGRFQALSGGLLSKEFEKLQGTDGDLKQEEEHQHKEDEEDKQQNPHAGPSADVEATLEDSLGVHPEHTRMLKERRPRVGRQQRLHRDTGSIAPPLSAAEALARVGDGRIHITGTPYGPPRREPVSQTSARHAKAAVRVAAPNAPVTVTVQTKRPDLNYQISPLVYGVNQYGYQSTAELTDAIADAGIRFVRKGGNTESRYNWLYDTRNSASDWFFENFPSTNPGDPSSVDQLLTTARTGGAEPLFTIPVLGWLPKGRGGCSFSVKKYGVQKSFDPWSTDCGNGQLANGTNILWHDVNDAAAPFGPAHQLKFVQGQVAKWGTAAQGGIKYYCLDNEPVWWSYVHWDIHPNPSSYSEILQKHLDYATAIKAADPTAKILGPVSGGWSDVFYSITDMQHGWATPPWKYYVNPVDRNRHGGVPHLAWYLDMMRAYELAYGTRLLDVVDVHGYVAGYAGNDDTDPATQAARVASTRSYWDPTFTCVSTTCDWVDPVTAPNGVPMFLVRVQQMVNSAYPGLGLALTEYGFGGNNDATGAVAQAEVLGIFGKLRLTMASVFPGPNKKSTVYQAFKMYGNYDGNGSQFGSLGVSAVSSNYTAVSTYAAVNNLKNTLTILIINLTPYAQPVTLSLLDVTTTKPIKFYLYDSANLTAILPMPSFPPSNSIFNTFTGYSLNMLEVSLG